MRCPGAGQDAGYELIHCGSVSTVLRRQGAGGGGRARACIRCAGAVGVRFRWTVGGCGELIGPMPEFCREVGGLSRC